jgi:hypothetical protein
MLRSLLYELLSYFFIFLDWWNGTHLDVNKKIFTVKYRYKLSSYIIHIPYEPLVGPRIGTIKGKKIPLSFQDGIPCFVSPEKLGFDDISDLTFDD